MNKLDSHQEVRKLLKSDHIVEIDYLRGFAIIAVLVIHTVRYIREIPSINSLVLINVVIDTLAHFAVPLFVFISGFVLSHRYYGQFSSFEFYNKRVKRILPTYVIISLFYILLNIFYSVLLYPNAGISDSLSLKTILLKLLTGDACFHLWFFVLIIQLYLVYPLIIKLYEICSAKGYEILLLLFSILCQIIWKAFSIYTISNQTSFSFFISNILLFSYIYYFILGIYVCKNIQSVLDRIGNVKVSIIFLLISILTIFNSYFNLYGPEIYGLAYKNLYQTQPYLVVLPTITKPVYYSGLFAVSFIISRKLVHRRLLLGKFFIILGKYSFGIYLIHAVYIYVGYLILKKIGILADEIMFYPALLVFVMAFSYISVYYLSYFPYSTLIGMTQHVNLDERRT